MSEALVERLRHWTYCYDFTKEHKEDLREAADRLEALEREVERLTLQAAVTETSLRAAEASLARKDEALRNIAEGNLGDDPWQANYAKIREVARAALDPGSGGWRDMADAPKDGMEILVAWKHRIGNGATIFIGCWKDRYGWVDQDRNPFSSDPDMWTHIPLFAAAPLPAPAGKPKGGA